ncbi:MAG TPA: hypothetical protein VGJ78_16770 [Vicinamibacterales bacterium]
MVVVRALRARGARRSSMSTSRAFIGPFLCISLAALSSFACDDGTTTRIGPSGVKTDARYISSSVTVANEIAAVPVPAAFCPFTSPFLLPASVVVRADRGTDLQLRQMQFRFIDIAGVTGAVRTIDGAELMTLFGSTLIPAFGTRTFPVTLPFGCVGGTTGTLFIQVAALDLVGRQNLTSLRVNVR